MNSEPPLLPPANSAEQTAATRWSLVRAAARGSKEALGELYRKHWPALYSYLRHCGETHHDAEDLINGFFARLLDSGVEAFGKADQNVGRFRDFMLGGMRYYRSNEHAKRVAIKRGGAQKFISIDERTQDGELATDPVDPHSPEEEFQQRWIGQLTEGAFKRLSTEQEAKGKQELLKALTPHLLDQRDSKGLKSIGDRCRMSTGALAVELHRLRKRLRVLLRAEIADTLMNPADVDQELKDLFGGRRWDPGSPHSPSPEPAPPRAQDP